MKRSLRLVYVMLFVLFVQPEGILKLCASDSAPAKDNDNASADRAWNDICNMVQAVESPSEWLTNRPTPEVLVKFRQKQADSAVEVASKEREFYTRFSDDARALKAKTTEREMLAQAERLGNVSARARLVEIDESLLNDPSTSENERFEIRLARLQRETRQQTTNGMDSALDVYAKGARLLLKDFPKRDEPYEMLLAVAMKASEDKTRLLAREIVEGAASEGVKAQARAILKKLELLGKPLDLKFTAMDGREVDLSKMKGKVVLVDFWATWSGPYAAAWPQHKTACEKWQSKGCAVVGISFDKEKEVLETFLAREKVEWPQYFDGQGWKNKIGLENGIKSLPSLWLVDKKGILRDQNATDNFEQKMEKYMAEP